MNAERRFKLWQACFDDGYLSFEDFEQIFALGQKAAFNECEDVYRCVKCGGIYLDSPVTICDCADDATEFRLCKLIDHDKGGQQ